MNNEHQHNSYELTWSPSNVYGLVNFLEVSVPVIFFSKLLVHVVAEL